MALLARTRARLEVDLTRVGMLQNDTIDHASPYGNSMLGVPSVLGRDSSFLGGATFPGLTGNGNNSGYVVGGRNPALQISESLRNALGNGGGDIGMPGPSAQKSECGPPFTTGLIAHYHVYRASPGNTAFCQA
jgi:hypothetical protein